MNKIRKYYGSAPVWTKVLAFLLFLTPLLVCAGLLGSMFAPILQPLIFGTAGSLFGYITILLFTRLDREVENIAGVKWKRTTPAVFLKGMLIGAFFFGLIFLMLITFSPLTVTYRPAVFNLKALLLILPILPLALMEEIAFRSYPQRLLAQKYGIWISQFAIAVVFALYHIGYGWDPVTAFTGPFVWAFLFGLAAIWSKGIAMPAGIHFALNLLQGLAGMKGSGHYSVFELGYPDGIEKMDITATENLGLILHGGILLVFLMLTELYKRTKSSKIN